MYSGVLFDRLRGLRRYLRSQRSQRMATAVWGATPPTPPRSAASAPGAPLVRTPACIQIQGLGLGIGAVRELKSKA